MGNRRINPTYIPLRDFLNHRITIKEYIMDQNNEKPAIEASAQPTANFAETSAQVGTPVEQPLEHRECSDKSYWVTKSVDVGLG